MSPVRKDSVDNTLSIPELNSTLKVAKCLHDLELAEADASQLVDEKLEQCSDLRQQVADKALKQLNHDLHEHQYCCLVPLDINESLLIEQIKARRPKVGRVRAPQITAPLPQLSDLLHLATHYEFPALPVSSVSVDYNSVLPHPLGITESVRRCLRRHTNHFPGVPHTIPL